MILVVGATGLLGTSIAQHLTQQGKAVRAVVRPSSDPVRVEALRTLGAELVQADLKNRASLDRACRGVRAVISTATTISRDQSVDALPDVDHRGQLDLVEAAKQAGVQHFVYVSYPKSFDGPDLHPLSRAKRDVERYLRASGMTYTILQPGYFFEVWLGPALGFDHENAKVQLFGDGDVPLGFISLHDVARAAVGSLEHPAARNATLPLLGENITGNDAVRAFEAASGREFEVQRVPVEALEAQFEMASTPLERSFSALMLATARGNPIREDGRLQQLGFTPMTLREYAQTAGAVTPV